MTAYRLALLWIALALLMTFNGVFRERVLRPVLGDAGIGPMVAADVLSAILGVGIILFATAVAFRRVELTTQWLWMASAVLVVPTIAFEFVVGRFVDGKTWSELLANYALWDGKLWPILLLLLALTPLIWGRWLRVAT
jgi:hypothetical protein